MNKYNLWYANIVDRARGRTIDGYAEKHHVVPQSLGGSNDKDNLVDLTAREHFICHWLLTKIYTGEAKAKMIYALNGMKRSNEFAQRYETKITARVYENLKKQFSMVHSATMKGRTPWNKGIPITEEQRERFSLKPGITGYAQVSGRNSISWKEKFKLDIYYVRNKSVALNIKILLSLIYLNGFFL